MTALPPLPPPATSPPSAPPTSLGTMTVDVDAIDVYSYAIAHRPVIRSMTVTNVDVDPAAGDVVVHVRIEGGTTEPLLEAAAFEIPALEPRDGKGFRAVRIAPNHRMLALLDEQLTADLVVTASVAGQVVGTARRAITFLAYDQWMHRPEFYDSFSSFVLPNHPIVTTFAARARDLLAERTGTGATTGYQTDDPVRLAAVANAAFDAISEARITYADPPPNFEGFGQRVRTPDIISEQRCATCLDTSVLYAGVVSATGLDPVLILTTGHAFAGYWVRSVGATPAMRELMARPVLDNPNDIAALFAAGELQVVETTFMTVDGTPRTFEQARRVDEPFFTDHIADVEALINVRAAREAGVRPIPSRRFVNGVVEVERELPERAAGSAWAPPIAPNQPSTPGITATPTTTLAAKLSAFDAPPRVRAWLSSLLDLSFGNPLINLRPGKTVFRFELPPRMLDALEDRLTTPGRTIELLPASRVPARVLDQASLDDALTADFVATGNLYSPDVARLEAAIETARAKVLAIEPTMPPARARQSAEASVAAEMTAALDSSMTGLKRRAREIESQTGSNNLFLAIGALRWTEPPVSGSRQRAGARDGVATAPLFLLPVRITGNATTGFHITADEGAEVTPNYCLLEKLRQTFDLVIPELETPDLDETGIDVDSTLAAVRAALGSQRIGGIVVEESAHLAVLNFATFRLWKDMRDHWQDFMHNPVVRHLVETPYEQFDDPVQLSPGAAAAEVLCPIEIDESQLEAVHRAVAGRSFVIEGPPGTGKSQTITNLLAASIAAKKRVLFVAQKQPALQVVKKRLEQIGLAPFCIDLHDKGSKPEQIRKQVRDALDFAGTDRDADWRELSSRLVAEEAALTAYRDTIHSRDEAGYSAWSARQEMIEIGPGDAAPIPPGFVQHAAPQIAAVRDALLDLPRVAGVAVLDAGNAWALCTQTDFTAIDQAALASTVSRLRSVLAQLGALPADVKQSLARIESLDDIDAVVATIDTATTVGLPSDAEVAAIGTPAWLAQRDESVRRLDAFAVGYADVLGALHTSAFTTDLRPIIAAGTEAATAGFLTRGKRQRAFQLLVGPVARDPSSPADALVGLLQRVEPARAEIASIGAMLIAVPGLRLPGAFTPLDPATVDQVRIRLAGLPVAAQRMRSPAATAIRRALAGGWLPGATTTDALRAAHEHWESLAASLSCTPASIARWRNGRGFFEAWAASDPAWSGSAPRFLALQRWCEVVATLTPLQAAGLDELVAAIVGGRVPLADAYDQFRRGVVAAALDERLEAGRADRFDGLAHDRRVQAYIGRAAQRRQLMRSVIPANLVAERPFKPGARFGEYGALERELSKTTRRLSIRKLVERYGEILPDLTPCFMMSPDSVARFIPPGSITFDLIVFDEASQIEVAEAIGAMGRAKAVVVVGDSKQMPPSTFGGTVVGNGHGASAAATDAGDGDFTGAEVDDAVFEDLESILSECVESNLPRLYLQCHYRSRHEGLIAFSNAAFYEGKLTTFPSPSTDGPPPIHWRRIDGTFDRSGTGDDFRTNLAEAQAIVADVARRLDHPATAQQTICIVTLNIQQQALVSRLLESSDHPRIAALLDDESDDGLIVRNLESVQGDERDVVLISVAFSPIVRTLTDGTLSRRLPLNFGPINRTGGERRLNVAVTRARSEVTVFCSFDPEEMRLAENPAKGLELLKQYLSIARDGAGRSGDLVARELSAPDLHRAEIAAALRERGLRVRENVGLSSFRIDITVGAANVSDWQVAVLLDGPGWARRSTVYDRDALPPNVLAIMGWQRVVRVWMPSWLQERERILDEIAAAVVAAETPPPPPPVTVPPPPPLAPPAGQLAAFASAPSVAVPQRTLQPTRETAFVAASVASLGERDVLDRLTDPVASALVRRAISETLAAEAPVHATRMAKIVATRFGLTRVTQGRADDILELAVEAYSRRGELGVFLWAASAEPDDWRGYRRTPAGIERKLEHVAPEEIVNAMTDIVAMSHSIQTDELLRVVAEIFGVRKLTTTARALLTNVLGAAVGQHRLVDDAGRVTLSG